MHQHGFIGFGIDPNWGIVPQHQMHAHNAPGYPHPMQPAGMEGALLPTGIPPGLHVGASMDPLEAVLGPFPCARLRGLPFEATIEDVLVFFQGLVVLDVVVVANGGSDGKGSGEAFVVFANPMDFQMALQRDRQSMGRRYVEVFQGKRSEYYAAIAAQHSNSVGEGETVTPEGLTPPGPWSGTGPPPPPPPPAQTLRVPMPQIGPNVGANVPGVGAVGIRGKGPGGIPGNRSGRGGGGAMQQGGHTGMRGSGRGGGIQVGEHTGYLRMRGLPFSATKKDIAEFFKAYKPVEESITLTCRSDGRATGEAYVAFDNPDEAKKAMALHRSTMGSRYIELFISNKEEHSRALSRSNGR